MKFRRNKDDQNNDTLGSEEQDKPKKKGNRLKKSVRRIGYAFLGLSAVFMAASIAERQGIPVSDYTTDPVYDAGRDIAGPILRPFGMAFEVQPKERAVVTWGGSLKSIFGYVAEPGYNLILPWGHNDPIFYSTAQAQREVEVGDVATRDNQTIEKGKLLLRFKIDGDDVGKIHEVAPIDPDDPQGRKLEPGESRESYLEQLDGLALKVFKEVLGDASSDTLAEERDLISNQLTQAMEEEIASSELAGLITLYDAAFTYFEWEPEFARTLTEMANEKNRRELANQKLKTIEIEANQRRKDSAGKRDARINIATGEAEAIRLEGEARGKALAAEIEPLSKEGADNLVRLKGYEAWEKGGAQVPSILNLQNGGNGGNGGTGVILDGRTILPFLDRQAPQEENKPEKVSSNTQAPKPAKPAP